MGIQSLILKNLKITKNNNKDTGSLKRTDEA